MTSHRKPRSVQLFLPVVFMWRFIYFSLYNHIQLSSNLMSGCDYSLFKVSPDLLLTLFKRSTINLFFLVAVKMCEMKSKRKHFLSQLNLLLVYFLLGPFVPGDVQIKAAASANT